MGDNFRIFLTILWFCLTKELLAQQNAPRSNAPRARLPTLTELGKDSRIVDDGQTGVLNGNEKKIESKMNEFNSNKLKSEDKATENGKTKGVAFSNGEGKTNKGKSIASQGRVASADSSLSAELRPGLFLGSTQKMRVNNMSNKENEEFVSFLFDEGSHGTELPRIRLDQMYGPSLNKFYLNALRVLCIITSGCLVGAIYYVTWIIFTRRSRDFVKYPNPMSDEQTAQYKIEIMDSYT